MPFCKPFEPPARWHVSSDSDPERTHLVDVLSFRGFGECSCEHFEFRILPAIKAGAMTPERCKHILAARDAFTDFMIQYLNTPQRYASQTE